MTRKPALNPLLLALGGVLVIAAGIAFFALSGDSKESEEEQVGTSERSSKSNSRSRDTGPRNLRDAKSAGKTAEERHQDFTPSEFREVLARISGDAREEWKILQKNYATEFDDPEEQKAFAERLGTITDREERREILRLRNAEIQRARQQAEASKSSQDRAREKQLQALIQIQGLSYMLKIVAEDPALAEQASALESVLKEWVRDYETMDLATFHQTFSELQAEITALRILHAAQRKADAPP